MGEEWKGKGILEELEDVSPVTQKKRSNKKAASMVETSLRSSSRLKQVSGGFRKSTYTDRKCLACSPNPPTLTVQVIRALGAKLCQIEEENLDEEVLLRKRKQPSPVGTKKKGTPHQKKPTGDEETSRDKSEDEE